MNAYLQFFFLKHIAQPTLEVIVHSFPPTWSLGTPTLLSLWTPLLDASSIINAHLGLQHLMDAYLVFKPSTSWMPRLPT